MKPYETILNTIRPDVSFGFSGIHVFRPADLESQQAGYSISPDGQSLIGDNNGDWRGNWVVIGHDELCGDPIFIDESEDGYPVYTAAHGEGRWDSVCIADSLVAFGAALDAIAVVAKGRDNPVALEQNPLSQTEKDKTLAIIREHNPQIELEFWQLLLSEP